MPRAKSQLASKDRCGGFVVIFNLYSIVILGKTNKTKHTLPYFNVVGLVAQAESSGSLY